MSISNTKQQTEWNGRAARNSAPMGLMRCTLQTVELELDSPFDGPKPPGKYVRASVLTFLSMQDFQKYQKAPAPFYIRTGSKGLHSNPSCAPNFFVNSHFKSIIYPAESPLLLAWLAPIFSVENAFKAFIVATGLDRLQSS